jgi:hypothetical protein
MRRISTFSVAGGVLMLLVAAANGASAGNLTSHTTTPKVQAIPQPLPPTTANKSAKTKSTGNDSPHGSLHLNYGKIEWKYTKQRP